MVPREFIQHTFSRTIVNLSVLFAIKGRIIFNKSQNDKKMKKMIIFLLIALMTSMASIAQSHRYQNGYFRKNGTFVTGHYKACSDRTNHNNFSTRGKRNPYTGIKGSRARDYSPRAYNYGRGRTIQTGSRGGQYYINRKGNKTYVPKRR